jgi:CRISPR-associated endonuclease Csn1
LARALNDTRYMSRLAREYVSHICPYATRVVPGRLTALLRAKFGLNDILGHRGEKNRNDHRHHAVDACVLGVTDQGLLQRVARANQAARDEGLTKLVKTMPMPWHTYRDHVVRAVSAIRVSHKPDHGYEGQMHNDTAYGLLSNGRVHHHKEVEGKRTDTVESLAVIPMAEPGQERRHGLLPDGTPRPYKGYKGDSNYCFQITEDAKGRWRGEVVTTFEAYQAVRRTGSPAVLRNPKATLSGKPLVMRLMRNDTVSLRVDNVRRLMRVVKIAASQVILVDLHEANVDKRNRNTDDDFRYQSKTAGSLQKSDARFATLSPIGDLKTHMHE